MRWIHSSVRIAVLVGAVVLGACSSPPNHGLLQGEPDADLQELVLRAAVKEVASGLMADVASVANEIALEADDPAVRRNALVFNLRVGEEVARAQFHPDPVVCAVDLLTLTLQIQAWLGEGSDGGDLFGPDQPKVRATLDRFASELEAVFESAQSQILRRQGADAAAQWAEENPLKGRYMRRVSVAPLLVRLITASGRGVLGMADSVEESVQSIETRLEVIGGNLPANLALLANIISESYLERLDVDALRKRVDAALQQIDELPTLIQREREATLVELDRQRTDTLAWLAAQQQAFQEFVELERSTSIARAEEMRAATLKDLDRQRQEIAAQLEALQARTLADLERQVTATVERLDATLVRSLGRPLEQQRTETLEAAGGLSRQLVAEGLGGARELVDVIFLRALVLLLIGGAALLLAAALLRRRSA